MNHLQLKAVSNLFVEKSSYLYAKGNQDLNKYWNSIEKKALYLIKEIQNGTKVVPLSLNEEESTIHVKHTKFGVILTRYYYDHAGKTVCVRM
jgi:hypothetical protein